MTPSSGSLLGRTHKTVVERHVCYVAESSYVSVVHEFSFVCVGVENTKKSVGECLFLINGWRARDEAHGQCLRR